MTAQPQITRNRTVRQMELDRHIGPTPLAEGAFDWPDLPVIRGKRQEPVLAWRVWRINDAGELISPFMSQAKTPPLPWHRGDNVSKTKACARNKRDRHPSDHRACTCGIRCVQSLTVVGAVIWAVRTMRRDKDSGWFVPCDPQNDIMLAYAQVACRGSIVAGTLAADDWRHTLRAETVTINGPIYVSDLTHADTLEKAHGVECLLMDETIGTAAPAGRP